MKSVFKLLAVVVVLLLCVVFLAPLFVSMEDITDTISEQVTQNTGRSLAIDGDTSLSVLPSLSVELNDVRLSNMATGSRPEMITMESLDVHISWLALFSGELSIDRFVIHNPDILLETDASGNANWDMLGPAESQTPADPQGGGGLPAGFDVRLGEVAIRGGSITYLDAAADTRQQLDALDLTIELPSLREDLKLQGSVQWLGETLELTLALATPARLIAGEDIHLKLALDSRLLTAKYEGDITVATTAVSGAFSLDVDSLEQLLAWQGVELEGSEAAYQRFALSGELQYDGDSVAVNQLEAALDALDIRGAATVALSEPPAIRAEVDLGMLDLNPYLSSPVADAAGGKAAPAAPPQPDAKPASPAPMEWDDTPLELDGLKAVNAHITLRSSGLHAGDVTLGENELEVRLNDGVLALFLQKFEAYEGKGTGNIRLNTRKQPYGINTQFKLAGVSAQPLLSALVGFDQLLGNGELDWELQTVGMSEADFVAALKGRLGFSFTDGAIYGANVAAIVRSAEAILKGDAAKVDLDHAFDKAEKTDFSELAGSLNFRKGVGRNDDLVLSSPLLRISGKGEVDLPRTRVDYSINTRLVESIEGQGGGKKSKGLSIPVRIKGPFHDIRLKPDISEAAEDEVKTRLKDELLKRFGGKNKD